MNPRVTRRLHDALSAARDIQQCVSGETLESYARSRLVQAAVHHELMIIGEALNAARQTDPSLVGDLPELPEWVGLRNVLIHIYSDVNPEVIWKTATTEIPELIEARQRILAEHGNEEG